MASKPPPIAISTIAYSGTTVAQNAIVIAYCGNEIFVFVPLSERLIARINSKPPTTETKVKAKSKPTEPHPP